MTDSELFGVFYYTYTSQKWIFPDKIVKDSIVIDWRDTKESVAQRAQIVAGLRAVIEYARPVPVPVSERPWEREGWLNAEERCWLFDHGYSCMMPPTWDFVHRCELEEICSTKKMATCLPHWALPLPLASPGDHFPGATEMVSGGEA